MAEKIKKTRPELLKQRRSLGSFERYLPTLVLKKQQIQMEILKTRSERDQIRQGINERVRMIESWVSLFSEPAPGPITRLVSVREVQSGQKNVAGIPLPVFEGIQFDIKSCSRFATPPWVDKGIVFVKELLELREKMKILVEQELLLSMELRKITQRVNLFEKVMIPRAKENIRIIKIQLAEEETAAVGRSKIAKAKSETEAPVQEVSA